MKILLREPTDSGILVDHVFDQDTLRVGRGTDCDIYLPDPLVGLHHATVRGESGAIVIEAAQDAGFMVNGTLRQQVTLKPGMVLGLGYSQLRVERTRQATLALRIVDRGDGRPDRATRRRQYRLMLTESGARPRRWTAVAAVSVLVVAMLVPLAAHFMPSLARAGASVGMNPQGAWESGGASRAHRHFMGECQACHINAFERAPDAGCLACHADVGHHATTTELAAHPGFADAACHDCHREHNGDAGLIVDNPADCTTCHAAPHDEFPNTDLQAVADFGDAHPDFSPTLATRDGDAIHWTRQPLHSAVSASGLYFNHARHTDPAGVRGDGADDDPVEVLACNDCHQPHDTADGGRGFAPVVFEQDCQRCHTLTFDTDEPDAVLPHAEADLVVKAIREHFVRRAMERVTERDGASEFERAQPAAPRWRRPGAEISEPARQAALDWARGASTRAIDEAFSRRACGVCHTTQQTDAGWRVAPLALADVFLPHARFSHAAHRSQDCADCHATATSTDARDVLLPDIAQCRSCHTGYGRADAAPSACVDCHGFHTAPMPWSVSDEAAP